VQVVEKGTGASNFNIGDVVLLPFLEKDATGVHPGWGAYSEYAVVGDWRAMAEGGCGPGSPDFLECYYAQQKIPEGFDPVGASMIVTFREVLSAMKRFGFQANANLVVFGAGPVGLCFTKSAKLLGMGPVISFDIVDEKVAEARRLGADYAFNSRNVDVKAEVLKILPGGADFVVDAVGLNALINDAMKLVKYNGKICCYGISPELGMNLNWGEAPYNWTVQFVQWPSKLEESEAHAQIVNWMKMGVLDAGDFISDVIPFDGIIDAFKMVEDGKAKKKIVIKF
jgi:threonine dehydrogenase-like Zn-dependent dehydrogenase